MSQNRIDVNHYETINSDKMYKTFEEAVEGGLDLLAKKDGFDFYSNSPTLSKPLPTNNYRVAVEFADDNTLIISQKILTSIEGMVELDFEWPQASEFAQKMVQSIKERHPFQTTAFFEVLPSVFSKLLGFKNRTYFSDRLYGDMLSILKIYDLDYLKLNNIFKSLVHEKANGIQNKYQEGVKETDKHSRSNKLKELHQLTAIIYGLDDNCLSEVNFIDHLTIDSTNSIKCSQQLTLMFNMLNIDLFAFSTFNKLANENLNHATSWDKLIINSLNMLVSIDSIINNALINLFIQNPEKGQNIADILQKYGKKQTTSPAYQDDYPLYDSILKRYSVNDGTNTILD